MISGERIQDLCDAYCGLQSDFDRNPHIASQTSKHVHLDRLTSPWDNPPRLFCYSHMVRTFMNCVHFLENDFTLVSHNEDTNIDETYLPLLEFPKLRFWHAQNVMVHHPKLGGLPIGIANAMWPHGNQEILRSVIDQRIPKVNSIFFNFSLWTNRAEREKCYEALKHLPWQPTQEFRSYLETLARHRYAICPPGNGVDCHRMWECLYLGVIPIVLRSVFTERIQARFPCILLDTWSELHEADLSSAAASAISFDAIKECIQTGKAYI